MADQSIRVTNLPDSGSPARVALELARLIHTAENGKYERKVFLDLYAECMEAAQGFRSTK